MRIIITGIIFLFMTSFVLFTENTSAGWFTFIIAIVLSAALIFDSLQNKRRKRLEREAAISEQEKTIREMYEKEARWEAQIKSGNLPVDATLETENRNSYFVYFGVVKDKGNGNADIISLPFGNAQDALTVTQTTEKMFSSRPYIRQSSKGRGYVIWFKDVRISTLLKYESQDGEMIEIENPVFGKETALLKSTHRQYTTGEDYERYVASRLKEIGFTNIGLTKASGDYGADVIAEMDGMKVCIQCKLYTKPVGISAVQEVIGAKSHYKCDHASVITNSTFTSSAKQLAQENGVQLIDNFT